MVFKQHAVGRIPADTIEAPRALPPFDQAAMDGYAIRLSGKNGVPLVLPISGRTLRWRQTRRVGTGDSPSRYDWCRPQCDAPGPILLGRQLI
ncbi:hypothetical protein [Mesorhizobium qingshengii]|uniref:hypothetical protein n=1 Tax=Mesorhizobium qingshengii TaxID=1165689 RepID=UPI003B3B57B8